MDAIKTIKNVSLQNLELYFKAPKGPKVQYLAPNNIIKVLESTITDQVKTLAERRLLKIS